VGLSGAEADPLLDAGVAGVPRGSRRPRSERRGCDKVQRIQGRRWPSETLKALTVSPSELFDLVETALTSLAIVVAGVWAYYRYLKGRVHRPSIEVEIRGRILESGGRSFLCASVTVENVGVSKVRIEQRGSGLRLSEYPASYPGSSSRFFPIRPRVLGVVPILESHSWLEPRERVSDEWMFSVPNSRAGFRLDVRLVSDEASWTSSAIIGAGGNPEQRSRAEKEA
jgi:hypothetical protein